MADQNFPSPAPAFRGSRQSPPKNFFDTASKWQVPGLNLPPASTLALYAGRLVDKVTGQSYSADELANLLRTVAVKHVVALDGGGNYRLQPDDNGSVLLINPEAVATVEIPADTLPIGFNCAVVRYQSDSVTFSGDGTAIFSANDLLSIAEQFSAASVLCTEENIFLITGSLA